MALRGLMYPETLYGRVWCLTKWPISTRLVAVDPRSPSLRGPADASSGTAPNSYRPSGVAARDPGGAGAGYCAPWVLSMGCPRSARAPWMRREPHVAFSSAMRMTSRSTSSATRGRPRGRRSLAPIKLLGDEAADPSARGSRASQGVARSPRDACDRAGGPAPQGGGVQYP